MSPQEIEQAARRVRNFMEVGLPTIVGVEGVKHFKQSFHNEGFTDKTLEKWPDITDERKVQKQRRNGDLPPILTDTGDLGDSPTSSTEGDTVIFSTDVVYAKRHNEGLDGMPKRQFMGPSEVLDQQIIAKFERELDKLFG